MKVIALLICHVISSVKGSKSFRVILYKKEPRCNVLDFYEGLLSNYKIILKRDDDTLCIKKSTSGNKAGNVVISFLHVTSAIHYLLQLPEQYETNQFCKIMAILEFVFRFTISFFSLEYARTICFVAINCSDFYPLF